MDAQPSVTIVIPTFRNPVSLQATLESIGRIEHDRFDVVVVDDGSGDDTPAVVAAAAAAHPSGPAMRCITKDNAGAASARNAGAMAATGEVLVFLDDDMLVPPTLLRDHVRTLEHFGPALVCGFRVFAPDLAAELATTPFGRYRLVIEPRQEWGDELGRYLTDAPPFPACCTPHPGGGVTANNLAVRRADFLAIGGFDEQFPHAGYEDQEIAARADEHGLQVLVDHGMLAWHNDRRLTLHQLCERQRRGASTAVLLAAKYPERAGGPAGIVALNGPIARRDGARTVARKLARKVLATTAARALVDRLIAVVERRAPGGKLLTRLYDVAVGTAIFRGVREGIARYGDGRAGRHTERLIAAGSGSQSPSHGAEG